MAFERMATESLDYMPYKYGNSKLLLRGPERELQGAYAVFLGGTETYGKYIEVPFPALVEQETGVTCANFGWPNAGVDVFLSEVDLLSACQAARAVFLQVPCALNMSNRFYSVHPRRNDRFIAPSALMKSVFPEVDFTEFHFTRHMAQHLQDAAPDRFQLVRDELQQAWISRMRLLMPQLNSNVVLLWFSACRPSENNASADLAQAPAFITRKMIDAVSPKATKVVELCASESAQVFNPKGMRFSEMEASAAAEVLGPRAHDEVAKVIAPVLRELVI